MPTGKKWLCSCTNWLRYYCFCSFNDTYLQHIKSWTRNIGNESQQKCWNRWRNNSQLYHHWLALKWWADVNASFKINEISPFNSSWISNALDGSKDYLVFDRFRLIRLLIEKKKNSMQERSNLKMRMIHLKKGLILMLL